MSRDLFGRSSDSIVQNVINSSREAEVTDRTTADNILQNNINNITIDSLKVTDFSSAADARITLQKGKASGLASLDNDGNLLISQMPLTAIIYCGTWNAFLNSPTLASGVGEKGCYYVVDSAGAANIDGITDWKVGDWIIYNGDKWQKIDNTDQVTSVAGKQGPVTLEFNNLTNVNVSPANNDLLQYDSSTNNWVNKTLSDVGITVLKTRIDGLTSQQTAGDVLKPPSFTTTERDALTLVDGLIIYNTTKNHLERCDDLFWYTVLDRKQPSDYPVIATPILTGNTSDTDFVVSASSVFNSDFQPNNMFLTTRRWLSGDGRYNTTTGLATNTDNIQGFDGAWFKVTLGDLKYISSYNMIPSEIGPQTIQWKILTSLDNATYTTVYNQNTDHNFTSTSSYGPDFILTSTILAKYIIVVITKITPGSLSRGTIKDFKFEGSVPSEFGYGGTITTSINSIRATNEGSIAGNARGQYSVDLQQVRANATHVVSGSHSAITAGANNTVSGNYSTASGFKNTVYGDYSTSSGSQNLSSGAFSTTVGRFNKARNENSIAMGTYADAFSSGTFVWADNSSTTVFQSASSNTFNIRANGGIKIETPMNTASRTESGEFLPIIVNNIQRYIKLYY